VSISFGAGFFTGCPINRAETTAARALETFTTDRLDSVRDEVAFCLGPESRRWHKPTLRRVPCSDHRQFISAIPYSCRTPGQSGLTCR